jgi:hypothetical protein
MAELKGADLFKNAGVELQQENSKYFVTLLTKNAADEAESAMNEERLNSASVAKIKMGEYRLSVSDPDNLSIGEITKFANAIKGAQKSEENVADARQNKLNSLKNITADSQPSVAVDGSIAFKLPDYITDSVAVVSELGTGSQLVGKSIKITDIDSITTETIAAAGMQLDTQKTAYKASNANRDDKIGQLNDFMKGKADVAVGDNNSLQIKLKSGSAQDMKILHDAAENFSLIGGDKGNASVSGQTLEIKDVSLLDDQKINALRVAFNPLFTRANKNQEVVNKLSQLLNVNISRDGLDYKLEKGFSADDANKIANELNTAIKGVAEVRNVSGKHYVYIDDTKLELAPDPESKSLYRQNISPTDNFTPKQINDIAAVVNKVEPVVVQQPPVAEAIPTSTPTSASSTAAPLQGGVAAGAVAATVAEAPAQPAPTTAAPDPVVPTAETPVPDSRIAALRALIEANHEKILTDIKDDTQKTELNMAKGKYLAHIEEYFGKDEKSFDGDKPNLHGYNRYLAEQAKKPENAEKKTDLEQAAEYGRGLQKVVPQDKQRERTWGEAATDNMGVIGAIGGALLGLLMGGGGIEGLLIAGVMGLVGMLAGPALGGFLGGLMGERKPTPDGPGKTPEVEKPVVLGNVKSLSELDTEKQTSKGVLTEDELKKALESVNTDKDGVISKAEYDEIPQAQRALFDAVLKQGVNKNAVAKDGSIDLGQLPAQTVGDQQIKGLFIGQ